MATLTSADLFAQYPELTTTDADSLIRIGTFLDIAEQVIVVGFSTTAQLTRCQLAVAAHLTALSNSDNCASSSGARSAHQATLEVSGVYLSVSAPLSSRRRKLLC